MRTALAILLVAASSFAAPKKIGDSAVFNPLMGAMANLRDNCDKASGPDLKACLIRFMKGVDPAAIAFTERLDQPGFLREFVPEGKIDLGRVHFPWRANFNDTVYFLNGEPPMLDAYGPEILSSLKLGVEGILFPDGYELPERIPTFTGIRYVADVSVRKCRACEELAYAKVAWDFTDQGKFLGAKALSTEPPPERKKTPHAIPRRKKPEPGAQ